MSEQPMNPMSVGLDDGYAFTKLALPDGRLVAIPSRARLGRANVTWLDNAEQRIFEYETEDQSFAVGEVDGEPTYFDAYPFSGLNRAIVQHGLQQAGLAAHSVHAVSGLPVSSFYLKDGIGFLLLKHTVLQSNNYLSELQRFFIVAKPLVSLHQSICCRTLYI